MLEKGGIGGLSLKARFGPLEIGVWGAVKEKALREGSSRNKSIAPEAIQGQQGREPVILGEVLRAHET